MVKRINETYKFDNEFEEKDKRISQIFDFIDSMMIEFYDDYKKSIFVNGSARDRFMKNLAKDIDNKIIDFISSDEAY